MKVLVACEYSGKVREAFRKLGHDAWSCDLLPSDDDSPYHIQGDVLDILGDGWDLMVAHPPCTHLAVSGAAHFHKKLKEQREAIQFVRKLLNAPIDHIALENPVSVISSYIRPADQTIHPWQFGHPEQKSTCLWLKNLPLLYPTKVVREYMLTLPVNERERTRYAPPSKDRWKLRSETFQGIADAMASQWGTKKLMRQEVLL